MVKALVSLAVEFAGTRYCVDFGNDCEDLEAVRNLQSRCHRDDNDVV